jgi:hypothetical protein
VWARRALILIFADAIDPDFDIRTPVLNVLGLVVAGGMLAMVLTIRK